MKLGWLSRLGIVLTAFGLPVTASYFASRQLADDREIHDTQLKICLEFAREKSGGRADLASDKCYNERESAPTYAGAIWREAFLFVAALFATAWLIALAVYWSVIWILGGRRRPVH